MWIALLEAVVSFDNDSDVNVVVFRADGDDFSVGLDLKDPSFHEESLDPMRGSHRNLFEAIVEMRKPTMAVLTGWVVGAGFELAMACDLRMASPSVRFMMPEAKVGLAANFGSQMLPRLLPRGVALELLYLGRELHLDEAQHYGLVNWVCSEDEAEGLTEDIALEIRSRAPLSLRRIGTMVHMGSAMPVPMATRFDPGPSPYESVDRWEGASAFRDRRTPEWQGR